MDLRMKMALEIAALLRLLSTLSKHLFNVLHVPFQAQGNRHVITGSIPRIVGYRARNTRITKGVSDNLADARCVTRSLPDRMSCPGRS
jgi:hypothetical protein